MYVAISYRDEGNGKAAFFDHMTLRNITGWATKVLIKEEMSLQFFGSYINSREACKLYSLPNDPNLPAISKNHGKNAAFIFLPGYTRESDSKQPKLHQDRLKFEKEVIRMALYRGQPILGVCAGSWTLWECLGGRLVDVSDHNYGGGMPRLSKNKPEVCNNKLIHRVQTVKGTFLSQSMGGKSGEPLDLAVNSVHWHAVNPGSTNLSNNVICTAKSVEDDNFAPNTRQGTLMKPENCVEAFETIHGVPMVGIQWHPEAFNKGDEHFNRHHGIFKALQTAGETYLNRGALNDAFKEHWKKNAYGEYAFFKPKHLGSVENSLLYSTPRGVDGKVSLCVKV